jgi:hypothetical protein
MKSKRMMQSAGEGKMFIKEAKLKKCILPFKNQLFRKKPSLGIILDTTPPFEKKKNQPKH